MTVSVWTASSTGLVPADEESAKLCTKLKVGQQVRAEVVRMRSPEQHRLWWALASIAFDQQSFYATLEDFAGAIKCALGHAYIVTMPDGSVLQRPKSIAFGNMKQAEFQQFFDATEKLLSEKMGISIETLRGEVGLPASIEAGADVLMAG
jgi:hypothetical protein